MSTRTRNRLHTMYITTGGAKTGIQYPHLSFSLTGSLGYGDLGETTTDELTPNYFALKKAGSHLPVNPFTNLKSEIILDTPVTNHVNKLWRYRTNNWDYRSEWFNHQAYGAFRHFNWDSLRNQPINMSGFPDPPNANRLLQAALANAKTSNFDIGTFLAEANKTFRLLATATDTFWRRAFRVEREVKRRAAGGAVDLLQSDLANVFAEVWLEGRYGWRQLYFDIKNAHEALQQMAKIAEGSLIRYTAYDEDENTEVISEPSGRGTYIYPPDQGNPSDGNIWYWKVTSKKRVSVRAGVGVVPRAAGSFGFIDPFVTGWEIIPFSFIVDWFFNVGQAVAAWSPTGRVDLKHGFVTTRYEEDIVIEGAPASREDFSWGYRLTEAEPSAMTLRRSYTSRTPASPTFNLMFDLNLDVWKIVDLLSIIRPRARRLLRRLKH